MRRFFVGLAILAFGVILSACEMRAEISVNDDGSGTMGVVFLMEPEYIDAARQSGVEDPFAEMRADLKDDPVPWQVEDLREGRLRGIRATFAFTSVDDLLRKAAEIGRDSGGSTGFEEEFTLRRDGGGWRFAGRSTDLKEEAGDDLPIPVEQLASLLKLQFRVTLPGKASSTNADDTTSSGGRTTFIWKPSINDSTVTFAARTTAAGAGFPTLPVALGAAVVGVGAVVGILRSRRPTPPTGETFSTDETLAPSEAQDQITT